MSFSTVSATSGIILEAAEKKLEVLNLRRQGKTYQEIADAVHCSVGYAHKVVTEELAKIHKELHESAEVLDQLEMDRLDRLQSIAHDKADKGDLNACIVELKIMERRAKLKALDAPSKDEAAKRIWDKMTDAELIAEADRLGIGVSDQLRSKLNGSELNEREEERPARVDDSSEGVGKSDSGELQTSA